MQQFQFIPVMAHSLLQSMVTTASARKKNKTWSEAHSEPFQAFKMERFAKIINR